jgi:chaperonin GroEL (HSP60 family)
MADRGRNAPVMLWKGSSIARELTAEGGAPDVAPRMLKEMLLAFDRDHSDGTSRLAVMTGACLNALWRESATGIAAEPLAEAVHLLAKQAGNQLVQKLQVNTDLIQVALGSGLPDKTAAELADLLRQTGPEAFFDISEGDSDVLNVSRTTGYVFDASTVGNEALASLSNASVMVADDVISDFGTIAAVLEGFAKKKRALVIAARGITGNALATLNANQAAKIVTVSALVPVEAGHQAADCLEDLAIATGATLVSERLGTRIESLRPTMLGRTEQFRFDHGRAIFINPSGREEGVSMRRNFLKAAAEKAKYLSLDVERLERRRARLGNLWCEIRIKGPTPQETAMLIERSKSAVANLHSAMRHGSTVGSGQAYARLASTLQTNGSTVNHAAARAVAATFRAVARQIAINRGSDSTDLPATRLMQDPVQLEKMILYQSVSFATSLLRCGTVITR